MIAILKREFKSYLHNVSGFIFISFLLTFVGFFTAAQNLFGGSASFEYALYNVVIVFLLTTILALLLRPLKAPLKKPNESAVFVGPLMMIVGFFTLVPLKAFARIRSFLVEIVILLTLEPLKQFPAIVGLLA
jgi:hypothetical protein